MVVPVQIAVAIPLVLMVMNVKTLLEYVHVNKDMLVPNVKFVTLQMVTKETCVMNAQMNGTLMQVPVPFAIVIQLELMVRHVILLLEHVLAMKDIQQEIVVNAKMITIMTQ